MIGRLEFETARLTTDEEGKTSLILAVSPQSRFAARQIVKGIKEQKAPCMAVISKARKKRTLDQNALLWKLLTIYAEAQSGGRRGDITPEDVYIHMLSKYGLAEFILTVPQAEEKLLRVFRVVKKVDVRQVGEKELTLYKCCYGSSSFDTKDMAMLIDGVFDELAAAGIDAETSRDVAVYYEDWRGYCAESCRADGKADG